MDYGTLSPSENKGTLAGRGQRTRQLNELASIGTPSENKGTLAGRGQRTRQLNELASIGTPSLVTRCVVQTI